MYKFLIKILSLFSQSFCLFTYQLSSAKVPGCHGNLAAGTRPILNFSSSIDPQRRILQVYRDDFITNNSIETLRPTTPLVDRPHAIFGHILRLPEILRHTLFWTTLSVSSEGLAIPGWKRPLGRPRKTWLQQVEDDQRVDADVSWSHA